MTEKKETPVSEQEVGFALEVRTTPESLAQSLSLLDNRSLIELVEALDQYMGDWDFTMDLASYFLDQVQVWAKECAEDSSWTRLADQAYQLLASIKRERS